MQTTVKAQSATTKDPTLTKGVKIAKIVMALVAVVTVVFGPGLLQTLYSGIPHVECRVLPIRNIGGQSFSGLVIENWGPAAAHSVVIKARDLGEIIQAIEFTSEDLLSLAEGGEGTEEFTLTLDRLSRGSSVSVYLVTDRPVLLEGRISVTFEEGRARPADGRIGNWRFSMLVAVRACQVVVLIIVLAVLRMRLWPVPNPTQ